MNEKTSKALKPVSVKKIILGIVLVVVIAIIAVIAVFTGIYFTRFQTLGSIEKMSAYEDGYDLYRMDVKYKYNLDHLIDAGVTDDESMAKALLSEAIPYLPIEFKTPNFACSAFTLKGEDGKVRMGRNYDFKTNTSAMLVYCAPEDGYKSVAFSALSNLKANTPMDSTKQKIATLLAPFICLDGVNEKGVSIAVLTLDSDPVKQDTGKKKIFTSLAIRLVLDRAATTEEAVNLLNQYDMYACSGRDYHFYITDASGDGRVIEYEPHSENREMVATPVNAVTNFFALYPDKVEPNQHNGIYGHGKERYEAMLTVFEEQKDHPTNETAWDALKAAAQDPSPTDITSNTQWSIVFNNTDRNLEIALRRHWDDVYKYDLNTNVLE